MLPGAISELKVILEKYLSAENLIDDAPVETLRRTTAVGGNLRQGSTASEEDARKEVTGPPKKIAFDADGKPTRAAESFAAKQGIAVESLYLMNTPRGEYLAAKQLIKGRTASECLAEILPRAIADITWPRTMYWTGISGARFIRPIRWVVAILGGQRLHFEYGGVAAANTLAGHRFLGKSRIPVKNFQEYVSELRENFVLVNPEERGDKIAKELASLVAEKGFRVNEDAELAGLVTYLNEYPSVIMGAFDASYLALPEEILITVMRGHQKYFAVRRASGGLAPHFLAVINMAGDPKGLVRGGHERVLRARFADAKFFWETDQKCRLADYLPMLAQVTFQAKLGTYGEKVERVRALARWLAEQLSARGITANIAAVDRAAELCKCDLVTGMVREFSELQGVMGGLYARAQGESEEISTAVYDHYKPAGLSDETPRNITGVILSIADKLDTLVGCFAVGVVPTGSSDPYALRRSAIGIIKLILEEKLPLSLSEIVAASARVFSGSGKKLEVSLEVQKQAMDFLVERARYIFQERDGFAADEVSAALAAGSDDLVDVVDRIKALREIRKTENFEPLAISFKRIRRILEKAGPNEQWRLPAVRPELFQEDAERKLHSSADRVAREAEEHKRARRYREALQGIAGLRPEVDDFFDHVMVMAEQEDVRRNRLTLLAELFSEFTTVADFSELAATER